MSGDQLWHKGASVDPRIHRFTVANDPQTDLELAPYDILGTAAHVRMLAYTGILAPGDAERLVCELAQLGEEARAGRFLIAPQQEDCHTAIEQALTAALGDTGKNVHLGRSRNDQVLLALRLYMRQAVFDLAAGIGGLATAFLDLAAQHTNTILPGYTHLRRAMPSSVALWATGFAEGLVEELEALEGVWRRLDRCPLGSGAGFGVPLPIDREYVAALLGFSRVQRSVTDVQNSRGRHELALAGWIASAACLLEKFLWDVALYSTEEFGFLHLPDAFTTGSSIMPQKRNPDVIELARARCAQLRARRTEIEQLASGLPGSYHRDFQLLKEPLILSINGLGELLQILALLLPHLEFDRERCAQACTGELFATHEAYRRVLAGELPFRDAYAAVGREILAGAFQAPSGLPAASHVGSAQNLGHAQTRAELEQLLASSTARQAAIQAHYAQLLYCAPDAM